MFIQRKHKIISVSVGTKMDSGCFFKEISIGLKPRGLAQFRMLVYS